MSWSYQKRIKIIPGVHLNFSKSGITTSIDVRGANLTSNIFSAELPSLTSEGMEGIKEAILLAQEQRKDLHKDLLQINKALSTSKVKLGFSYIFLYGLISKTISNNIKADIQAQKDAIVGVKQQIDNCHVSVDVDFQSHVEWQYEQLVKCFKKLCNSAKIWDVTASVFQDTRITRTSTSTLVVKKEVTFGIKGIPDIKSTLEPLWLHNINGADIFIYPSFVMMYSSERQFSVVKINEIDLQHDSIRFVETGVIPADSKIIDKTWARVNRNGTPDRRFKNNHQIPVVQYGEITLRSKIGINEAYYFSNYEYSLDFAKAFHDFQEAIKPSKSYEVNSQAKSVSMALEAEERQTSKLATEENKVNTNEISQKTPDILQTEASVVTELGKECGKITKLAGAVDQSEIKLYLALEEWKRFPIHLVPNLAIALKVDTKSNFLIITSSNKDITPLKKGDTFSIYFDENSFIEKQFLVGRTLSGKTVTNIIVLSDLELIQLSQRLVNSIVTKSVIIMPYEFTDISNNQYSNTLKGKELFKIICERIIGVKELLINGGQ